MRLPAFDRSSALSPGQAFDAKDFLRRLRPDDLQVEIEAA